MENSAVLFWLLFAGRSNVARLKLTLRVCSFAAMFLFGNVAYAQDYTAESVQASCAHWLKVHINAKKEFKGNSEDVSVFPSERLEAFCGQAALRV